MSQIPTLIFSFMKRSTLLQRLYSTSETAKRPKFLLQKRHVRDTHQDSQPHNVHDDATVSIMNDDATSAI